MWNRSIPTVLSIFCGTGVVVASSIFHGAICDKNEIILEGKLLSDRKYELQKAQRLSSNDAQLMEIHRFPKHMSHDDIQEILEFEKKNKGSVGVSRRDGNGVKRMDGTWGTSYLSTNGLFQREKGNLLAKLLDAAKTADSYHNWGLLNGSQEDFHIRVIECHTVEKGGSLRDVHHCDQGSLVTIDVMCSQDSEFTGGIFSTLESSGNLQRHLFKYGDVIVFPSHKYHCIEPVTSGTRRVLVVELWEGKDRFCAHRCDDPAGDCKYSILHNQMDMMVKCSFPEIDPW